MNLPVKAILITVLLVSLHTSARAQQSFIDSIRTMLVDLNDQIKCAPDNQLLEHIIPFCTGDTLNDSLAAGLKELISEQFILEQGMRQPVSPHLWKKYAAFILHITLYFTKTVNEKDHRQDIMRVAITKITLAQYLEATASFAQARQLLLHIQFTEPFLQSRWLHYMARSYDNFYKMDSCYILYKLSLLKNPNKTREENILYSMTLFLFAEFCRSHNKPDNVIPLYQQQLELRKKIHGENSAGYGYWLIVTADCYTYMAKYSLALEMNFKAQKITLNTIGGQTNQYALCLNNIGEVYYRTGEYDKALSYALQSLAIKKKIFGNDYFDNVVNLHNLATLYIRMGLYNEAIPLLKESMSLSKKYFGEDLVYAVDLHPLAEAYEYLGEYDKALPLYQQAIQKLDQQPGDGRNVYYPRMLHSAACLYTKLGLYEKSIKLFQETLVIKEHVFGKLNPEYTKTLNSLAETFMLAGDYKKALSVQLQSVALTKKLFGDTHPNIATGLYNLAALYYEQHNFQKAQEYCNQALQMQKKIFDKSHPDIATSYDMLGNIYRQMHHYNAALDYYQRAFEIRKTTMTTTHPDYIKSLCNLGVMYDIKGRAQQAAQLFAAADSASLLHIEQSYTTFSEEEKLIYLDNSEEQFQYLPSLLYLHKTNSAEIVNRIYSDAIALKSVVLFHQQETYNGIRKSNDSAALQLYNSWRFNKTVLGRQTLLTQDKRRSDFDSLQEATTQQEERLSRFSASFRNNSLKVPAGAAEITRHLSNDEAAIEFIKFRLYKNNWTDSIIYAALVLLPGKNNAAFVPLFEESQLKKLLRFSNNNGEAAVDFLYPPANKETKVSNTLYQLVWQPLQPLLENTHTVYYSPAGLLCNLSFAALHTGKEQLLADKYNLRQVVCTRNIAQSAEKKSTLTTASLWGAINYNKAGITQSPAYDSSNTFLFNPINNLNGINKNYSIRSWQSLPGTKKEIENIASSLQQKNIVCYLQSDSIASEEQFKKMDGVSPALIHIATHGFFIPTITTLKANYYSIGLNSFSLQQNPMFRSGLLLAGANETWSGNKTQSNAEDGVLTAYEIAQLDLSNTQLVTLSSCETALGDIKDNEGVFGLQRAFKMAGAKQVLTTLWKVPDKETTELMLLFYDALLKTNDVAKALHAAQLEMKKKYTPYYWAGFVLIE